MVDLSKLTKYVQEQRVPLINEVSLKATTVPYLSWQSDIQTSAKLNLLNTSVAFKSGLECNWTGGSSQALSQRELKTGVIKVEQAYCVRAIADYWAQYQVRIAADPGALPFEEDFTNGIVRAVDEAVEKAVWQGDTSSSVDNLKYFDGFLKIIDAEPDKVEVDTASLSTVYDKVKAVYAAIPAKAFERGDVQIFMGSDDYRTLVQELVTANLYHYNPGDAGKGNEYMLPGTDIKVIGVNGLNGKHRIVAGSKYNMFYGFDIDSTDREFKFWYSEDNDEYRLRIVFNAGVQVAFPNEVVITKA